MDEPLPLPVGYGLTSGHPCRVRHVYARIPVQCTTVQQHNRRLRTNERRIQLYRVRLRIRSTSYISRVVITHQSAAVRILYTVQRTSYTSHNAQAHDNSFVSKYVGTGAAISHMCMAMETVSVAAAACTTHRKRAAAGSADRRHISHHSSLQKAAD